MKYSDSQPTETYDFKIDDQKSVTSESIQLQNQHITLPPELCSSYSKDDDTEYQELCGSASIILQTHFGDFIFPDVPVKHKVIYTYLPISSNITRYINVATFMINKCTDVVSFNELH